jgi:Flp pilus assembly protein TadB
VAVDASLSLLFVASSLTIGLGIALAWEPLVTTWDELALGQVRDCVALGRTVGLPETQVRAGMRVWGLALVGIPAALIGLAQAVTLVPVTVWIVYLAPRWILTAVIGRRRRRLRDQLVPVCFTLANTSRAGLSLAQGIRLAGTEAPEPVRTELLRIEGDYNRGRTLAQSLADAAERLDLNGFHMLAAALLTCLERGGPITETLDGLAHAVQENQRLEMKMDSLSASGRLSVAAMGVFPVVFLAANALIEQESSRLMLVTMPGQAMLTIVVVLTVWSVRWGMRITRFEAIA